MLSTRYLAVKLSFTFTLFFIIFLSKTYYSPIRLGDRSAREPRKNVPAPVSFSKVTDNSTFGFPKIFFIHISTRFDLLDAATIQAFLSGVQFEVFPAVEASMIKDKGMPPTHDKERLRGAEKGCWRAHANELPSALILEGDAAWDIHVRTIMTNFHEHFTSLLQLLNSTQIPKVGRHGQAAANDSAQPVFPEPPRPMAQQTLGYPLLRPLRRDPTQPRAHAQIRRRTRPRLTKELLRPPARQRTSRPQVGRHSVVQPTIMSQWKYVPGIGMNLRGSNNDVQESKQEVEDDEDPKAWETVSQTGIVWRPMEYFVDAALKEMTLQVAWKRIFGGERPPLQVTGV
ncbi:hypothetical protein CSAL01_07709 [Colletotrichum salicis]|uniref:Glycosyltransferase family 25 n=1 Tax=Colletotrichum salicis TaxID=1209931 RepID=A0A135UII9_9PEZI|nr:hypothetical protein CSAL01_07709 [Colletotrichum salicis]